MAKTKTVVGFSPSRARRIRKNAGGVHNTQFQEKQLIPGGGGGSVEIYKYVLRNTMAVFSTFYRANADIFLPFDETDTATPVAENAILYDTTLVPMATEQIAGDDGWCFKGNDGKYYVLSPACDQKECCGGEGGGTVDPVGGGETVEPTTLVFGT